MNMLASSKHILLIYKHTLFQARLSVTVILNLIQDPVVCSNVAV